MRSDHKAFQSTKLAYYSRDTVHGIDVELMRTEEHLNVYLNVHSLPIAPHQGDPQKAVVTFTIEEETLHFSAYRLAGGQRFLLPEDARQVLIEALAHNNPVLISLASYRSLIQPEDFNAKFEQLLHPFPLQNPFQLPFLFAY